MLERDQVKKIFDAVLSEVAFPEAFVSLSGMNEALSRFRRERHGTERGSQARA
ncbi:hypothetical protein HS125_10155 [bacterium]|nr:hypothetical protein [bacterium]